MPDIHPAAQVTIAIVIGMVFALAMWRKIPISLRGGPVSVDVSVAKQLKEIKTDIGKINKAVNNVPANMPPLVSRVERVESLVQWQADATHKIASHVGLVLPEPPPDERNTTRSL